MITEWLWKKIELAFSLVTLLLMFGVLVFLANVEIKDLDLWLHLSAGRYILQTGTIPQVDIFSATVTGKPWINHEWLFQVIVAKLYELGGVDALISFRVVIVGLTFFILASLGFKEDQKAFVLILLFLFLFAYPARFTIRPDMLSVLFLLCLIHSLGRYLNDKFIFPAVFILQVLWTNIHGFFIFGPFIILLSLAGEFIKRSFPLPFQWKTIGRLDNAEVKKLALLLGVSLAACLVSPYFINGLIYPLKILFTLSGENKIFFQYIQELEPTITWAGIGNWNIYPEFQLIAIISFFSFLLNYRRIDVGLFLFWIVFLVFSVSAVRNLVFFCVAGYIAAVINFYTAYRSGDLPIIFRSKGSENAVKVIVIVIVAVLTLKGLDKYSLQGYYDFDTDTRKSDYGGISLRNYPYKAVAFLKENKIKGNFFNEFNVGAYLIGQVYPDIRVFIDGRTEVYGSEFFEYYRKVKRSGGKLFEEAADKYNLSGALISLHQGIVSEELLKYLSHSDDWKPVYFDHDAVIFLRNDAYNRSWIDRFALNLDQWVPPSIDLHKMEIRPVQPFRFLYRAQALKAMGFSDKAQHQALEALKATPDYAEVYEFLAELYLERKDYPQAYEAARKAKVLNINSSKVRYLLAKSMLYTGDIVGAKKYASGLMNSDDNAKVMYLMTMVRIQQGDFDEAELFFKKALDKNIYFVDDMLEALQAFVAAGRKDVVERLREQIKEKAEGASVISKVDELLAAVK